MKISFDPAKREKTLRERGIDFADAETLFGGQLLRKPMIDTNTAKRGCKHFALSKAA